MRERAVQDTAISITSLNAVAVLKSTGTQPLLLQTSQVMGPLLPPAQLRGHGFLHRPPDSLPLIGVFSSPLFAGFRPHSFAASYITWSHVPAQRKALYPTSAGFS